MLLSQEKSTSLQLLFLKIEKRHTIISCTMLYILKQIANFIQCMFLIKLSITYIHLNIENGFSVKFLEWKGQQI